MTPTSPFKGVLFARRVEYWTVLVVRALSSAFWQNRRRRVFEMAGEAGQRKQVENGTRATQAS